MKILFQERIADREFRELGSPDRLNQKSVVYMTEESLLEWFRQPLSYLHTMSWSENDGNFGLWFVNDSGFTVHEVDLVCDDPSESPQLRDLLGVVKEQQAAQRYRVS